MIWPSEITCNNKITCPGLHTLDPFNCAGYEIVIFYPGRLFCTGISDSVLTLPGVCGTMDVIMYWQNDIASRIIFIIIPNNSGSTVVYQNVSQCDNAVPMRSGIFTEGEKIVGMQFNARTTPMPVPFLYEPLWAGKDIPDPRPGLGRIWGAERTEIFQDEQRFDWGRIKEIWLENWMSNPKYTLESILVEKSPTSSAWAYMLPRQFPGARYILSIRNPYATIEGIRRRIMKNQNTRLDLGTCTRHWIKTAELQIQNINRLPRSIWFTYEDMCAKTAEVENRIRTLIPELRAFHLTGITSMNEKSIWNLTGMELRKINRRLEKHANLMDFFNYEFIN